MRTAALPNPERRIADYYAVEADLRARAVSLYDQAQDARIAARSRPNDRVARAFAEQLSAVALDAERAMYVEVR
jgi:hypothetical protein